MQCVECCDRFCHGFARVRCRLHGKTRAVRRRHYAVPRSDAIRFDQYCEKWLERKLSPTTPEKGDHRCIKVFVDLYGTQHLAVIAKRHIGQLVEHLQTMTQRGKPLTATTMSNYLVFSIEQRLSSPLAWFRLKIGA
jgi:hypothetical protein